MQLVFRAARTLILCFLLVYVLSMRRLCEHGSNYFQSSVVIWSTTGNGSCAIRTEHAYRLDAELRPTYAAGGQFGQESMHRLVFRNSDLPQTVTERVCVPWSVLIEIGYRVQFFESVGMEMYAPEFSEAVVALDGVDIEIEGFVIPYDQTGEQIALSANPFAACFFCGKASPASVMTLNLARSKRRYKTDDFRRFAGRLRLNYDNPDEFYYVLEGAHEVE